MGAATSGTDFEPWKYDGTNFTFLGEVNAFGTNASPIFWTVCRNLAFFTAADGVHGTGYQLWSCDGTNLTRLSNFVTGGFYDFTFNNTLYFEANDGVSGVEFWKYDGRNISWLRILIRERLPDCCPCRFQLSRQLYPSSQRWTSRFRALADGRPVRRFSHHSSQNSRQ